MNPEYSKIEERRFSLDFTAEFTRFIGSGKNSAFFDKPWSSKEHRQRISRLLSDYPVNFHEFESSTLSIQSLRKEIVGSIKEESNTDSDFITLCNTMENASKPGLVMIYRCSELTSVSVQFLTSLNSFLKQSKSKWKIVYFGEIEGVYPPHLELLAPDYIYTNLEMAKRPPKIQISRTMFTLLCILTALCLYAAPYYWSIIKSYYAPFENKVTISPQTALENQGDPFKYSQAGRNWVDQDIDTWNSRVAEFDRAMSKFKQDSLPNINLDPKTQSETGAVKQINKSLKSAASKGDIDFVKTNISSKQGINILGPNRETLLIIASSSGQLDLVKWLLSNGANVGLSDEDNGSALYYAAVNGHVEVAKILIKSDASTTQVSKLNKTPLMAAVHNNYVGLSALLINANSDIDQQDHSGWSALYFAIWNENLEMTTLLLENGASSSLKDRDGYTPKDIAKAKNNLEILDQLNEW